MKLNNKQEEEIYNIVKEIKKELNNLPLNVGSISLLNKVKKQLSKHLSRKNSINLKEDLQTHYKTLEKNEHLETTTENWNLEEEYENFEFDPILLQEILN